MKNMDHATMMAIVCGLCAASLAACDGRGQTSAAAANPRADAKASGLTLVLSNLWQFPGAERKGDWPAFALRIRNCTGSRVKVWDVLFDPTFLARLVDEQGKEIPLLRGDLHDEGAAKEFVEMGVDEEVVIEFALERLINFRALKNGRYRMKCVLDWTGRKTVGQDGLWGGKSESNTVEFYFRWERSF